MLTEEQRQQVVAFLKNGMSVREASRKTGISDFTVRKYRDLHNIPAKKSHRPNLSGEERSRIIALLEQGRSVHYIKNKLNHAERTVRLIRNKLKIEARPGSLKKQAIALFAMGKTFQEVMQETGCSDTTARRYCPPNMIPPPRIRRLKKQEGREPKLAARAVKKFPVHPEVVMAKNRLLMAFKTQDENELGKARFELERLLEKYHPRHSRPLDQLDADAKNRPGPLERQEASGGGGMTVRLRRKISIREFIAGNMSDIRYGRDVIPRYWRHLDEIENGVTAWLLFGDEIWRGGTEEEYESVIVEY